MKTKILILIVCAFVIFNGSCSRNVDNELAASREVSKALGTQLKARLIEAMQSGGSEAAISACNLDAMKISEDVSLKNNIEVGRTSLKIRNPENQADEWETKQLKWFISQFKNNTDIKQLEVSEVMDVGGEKILRYMKAIPLQEPCLLCHGENLAPSIKEKIKELYPDDQATGYKLGEIRGAFTTKVNL